MRPIVWSWAVLTALCLCGCLAPLIAPHAPHAGSLLFGKLPPVWVPGGDGRFVLGSDELGRDILSELIWGSRQSLVVAVAAVALAGAVGVGVGTLAAYYGALADATVSGLVEVQLALPQFLVALTIAASLGPGLFNVILTLAITSWAMYARVVRAQLRVVRAADFVWGARAIGASDVRIMFRHMLPNVIGPMVVLACATAANTILAEAALSFLGLSVGPEVPTWGGMIAAGRDEVMPGRWWIYAFPGLAILLVALAANATGDWLRDRLDPRGRAPRCSRRARVPVGGEVVQPRNVQSQAVHRLEPGGPAHDARR